MVRLVAIKPHNPDGNRRYKAGEPYDKEVSESVARTLIAMKLARRADDEPSKKREYKRRDMKAED